MRKLEVYSDKDTGEHRVMIDGAEATGVHSIVVYPKGSASPNTQEFFLVNPTEPDLRPSTDQMILQDPMNVTSFGHGEDTPAPSDFTKAQRDMLSYLTNLRNRNNRSPERSERESTKAAEPAPKRIRTLGPGRRLR